jgi:dienelactone hydrolase
MGRSLITVIGLLIVALLAVLVGAAGPKFPPDETMDVSSLTLTSEQFLRGDTANGIPVTLKGKLRFPNWDPRLPAIVLLHGSEGFLSSPAYRWGEFFNKMGIATLRLDSFGGRRIEQIAMDQSQLSPFAQIYDSYRAVDVLAAHPRIDPSRIAVMGFSRGGFAALYASMRRFQDLYGPTKARIAAHLPFYPVCSIQLIGELDIADAPIREFHGAADDWNLAAPCRDYVTRLRATGKNVDIAEYPGALHAFDDPDSPPRLVLPTAQNMAKCRRREENGKIINIDTGKPFTYNDTCMELGPTVGYDKEATAAAQAAVKEFLTGVFRLISHGGERDWESRRY